MNFLVKIIFFVFFNNIVVFAQEIIVIELHEDIINKKADQEQTEQLVNDTIFENNLDETGDSKDVDIVDEKIAEENIVQNEEIKNDNANLEILPISGYWEYSEKNNLDYLFSNLKNSQSKVINNYFIEILTQFSDSPKSYSQAEFDYLRINTLINLGYKQEALRLFNDLTTYENYKDYYDRIKLDFYLSSNQLAEACSFKDNLQKINQDNNNNILKVSIFCALLENKPEEAEFLNSLLLDTQDKDEYFQKIYYNLKNDITDPIDLIEEKLDQSSYALYSAMIKIGNLPFSEKFLNFDSANLTLSIILSSSTDISLRLKSAHRAYDLGLFKAESMSALYQSVDFSSEELNNWSESLKKYSNDPEMVMALLFQNASVQLLPITKLESLKVFWDFAINNDFEELAYKLSNNLIESTDTSAELSDYSISIARAHIYNKNFELAEKWIVFFENYISNRDEVDLQKLDSVKFLLDLQKSENNDIFIGNLEKNLFNKIEKEGSLDNYSETLKTIFLLILDGNNSKSKVQFDKKIIDERIMPSTYIINKIYELSENNQIGELILTILVSLNDKSWDELHPTHLKIVLESLKRAKLDDLFKDLIIEIFEESKII
tara:strand:- start:1626 stop:3440 length:1815 start_codon:yes stop_codon:yes gene_type:complete